MFLKDGVCESVFENLSDGVYLVDTERKILYWNKRAEEITGFKKTEVLNSHCSDNILKHIDEKGTELCKGECPLVYAIKNNTFVEKQVFLHNKSGHRIPVYVKVLPIADETGKVMGAIKIFNEVTDVKIIKTELEKLRNLAFIDELTGVLNRRGLDFFIKEKIKETKRYNRKFAVLFIDLDNFKDINDLYGHHIGDKVLKMIGETLKSNLRANDIVARFGGDEFIVIFEIEDINSIEELAQKMITLIENSFFEEKGQIIKVSASIGGVMIKKEDTPEKLLKKADRLMYVSKAKGKNRYTISNK